MQVNLDFKSNLILRIIEINLDLKFKLYLKILVENVIDAFKN